MKKTIILFALLLKIVFSSAQSNYYVSPSGNNSNIGSFGSPWLTIQHGLNQLSANDTLNLLTGTYPEKIDIPLSNICLRNYVSDTPIIDANGITTQNSVISINNKSGITIDGLEIRNNIQNDAQGILVDGTGSNITIKNCNIHDIHFSSNPLASVNATTNAQGIIVYGTNSSTAIQNLKILNNELYDCRLGYSEGIAVNGNVDGFEVSDNMVYNLTNIGIDIIGHEGTCSNPANDQARNGIVKNNIIHDCISPYATSGGIYIDGGKAIVVENNYSYHNGYGIEIGCENIGKTTDSIMIRNNIFYDNEICALALGGFDYPSGSGKVINSTFQNNTCYYNDFSNSGSGEFYLSYSENSIIQNNIFYLSSQNTLTYSELGQPSLTFNYNVFYSLGGAGLMNADWNGASYSSFSSFQSGTGTNASSIFSDPLFVSPGIASPDFHIQSTSPAINTGNPSFIPASGETDIDTEARTNGIVDSGADEFYNTTGISDLALSTGYSVFPNPTNGISTIQFNDGKNHSVQIVLPSGQTIGDSKNNFSQNLEIDLTKFKVGIYFCIIDDTQILKIVKQ